MMNVNMSLSALLLGHDSCVSRKKKQDRSPNAVRMSHADISLQPLGWVL